MDEQNQVDQTPLHAEGTTEVANPDPTPNEIIPDGFVKTADGKLIEKANAAYWLAKHPNNERIEVSATGVHYFRQQNGSLKRLTPKIKKDEKK
jgi:hypothetical protein